VRLLKEWPQDLVSLKRAQTLAFYTGRQDLMLRLAQMVTTSTVMQSSLERLLAGHMHVHTLDFRTPKKGSKQVCPADTCL
jgi:hypothetical protein